MKKKSNLNITVEKLTVAAMMTAMSVVIGIFCKTALNFGGGLFRITFENLPIILSGVVFGPFVGGTVGGLSDLISYLLSGQTYPPNLIVTAGAISVGIVSGIVSRYVVKKRGSLQLAVSGGAAHIVGSMIIKPIGLYQFYGILVLWRIPVYLVIAPLEICAICLILKRKNLARAIGYLGGEDNELR